MPLSKKILVVAVFLSSQIVLAQNNGGNIFTITGGLSYSTFGSSDLDTEWKEGYFFGIRKDLKLVPALFLNVGLLYSQQGAIVDEKQLGDIEFKAGYLDFPIGLKVKLGPMFVTGGVSGNIKIEDNFDSIDSASEIDGFDWVYSVGVGLQVSVVSLDVRWNNSFSDTGEISFNDTFDPIENSYFLVGLGISFNRK
jgi:hypothetical protein